MSVEMTKQPQTQTIADQGERPLVLRSKLTGPIRKLSMLEKSLLFAELAMIAYNDERECKEAASKIGLPQSRLYDNDGAQAVRFENDTDCVIAFRGTEGSEWNDIKADANAIQVLLESGARVHRGFKGEVDDIWPLLNQELPKSGKDIWFTGHSLGGAMATVCAGVCLASKEVPDPVELYTYGSPRVGCRRYAQEYVVDHKRWVNNNDIVTRVPPPWLGYRHSGMEIYIDSRGRIRQLTGIRRAWDRLKGVFMSLRRYKFDYISDHSIHDYIAAIVAQMEKEQANRR